MLYEKLERYKKLYSEYIGHAVDLHNYHIAFLNNLGFRTAKDVRRSLKYMIRIEREMQDIAWKVRLESGILKRQAKIKEKARLAKEKANRRAHPRKKGPKGKNNGLS